MKMTDETILSTPPEPADARVREIGYLVCCPDGCIAQKDALNVQFKGCFVERDTFPQSNAGKSARAIASLSPQVGEEETARTIPDVHESSCARHNEPAYPAGECNCDGPKKAWLAYEKRELERYTALQNNWLATELADVERQPNRQEPSPALPVQGEGKLREIISAMSDALNGSLIRSSIGVSWDNFKGLVLRPDAARVVLSALRAAKPEAGDEWQPIETAPKDGTRFLAWAKMIADEFDEDDKIIKHNKISYYQALVQWCFGSLIEVPYRGSIPINVIYEKWRPLPAPPRLQQQGG